MPRIEFLQRAATEQFFARPDRPESDLWPTQAVEVECVNAFRRRDAAHASQVFLEQFADLGTGQVVAPDVHRAQGSSEAAYAAAAIMSSTFSGATTGIIGALVAVDRAPVLKASNCRTM